MVYYGCMDAIQGTGYVTKVADGVDDERTRPQKRTHREQILRGIHTPTDGPPLLLERVRASVDDPSNHPFLRFSPQPHPPP